MAKILTMSRNNIGSTSGTYKLGDVVAIFPDDHVFAKGELDTSVFTIVDSVKTVEGLQYLLQPDLQALGSRAALKTPKLTKTLLRTERPFNTRKRYKVENGITIDKQRV